LNNWTGHGVASVRRRTSFHGHSTIASRSGRPATSRSERSFGVAAFSSASAWSWSSANTRGSAPAPVHAAIVAATSASATGSSRTTPTGTPGPRTIHGTRVSECHSSSPWPIIACSKNSSPWSATSTTSVRDDSSS
jgi:hypothetical protein